MRSRGSAKTGRSPHAASLRKRRHTTTAICDSQDHPRLTVQNITFVDGNASGQEPDGGGAIFVRGGRFKLVNTRFFNNTCDGFETQGFPGIFVLASGDPQVIDSTLRESCD